MAGLARIRSDRRQYRDADEEIAELNSSGAVLRRYVMGPGVDDRVAWIEGGSVTPAASARKYYHVNHQGSVLALSAASGTISQRLAYDEYGVASAATAPTGQPYRYTGRRFDEETGLYYYRARYYAPEIGRFLQTDPVGYEDDLNLYGYVKNDPLNGTDPTGKYLEAGFEAVSLAVGVDSFISNVSSGNYGSAAADAGGVVVSDLKDAKALVQAAGKIDGPGRKGGVETRALNEAVGKKAEAGGAVRTGGGLDQKETRFAGGEGETTRYSDNSFQDGDGGFQVQTVDTRADGSLTNRESAAAADIAGRSQQPVVCVPKCK